ncbi:MAG: hypothetical protein AUJ47_04030 [Candidatus Marinimicrobia bacterium CG1_02_48_14]|nr:MAG: hypothetical protein AUJ47_04030 [Candidatus Marinimicrobia bacterium CG1_02_48_14]
MFRHGLSCIVILGLVSLSFGQNAKMDSVEIDFRVEPVGSSILINRLPIGNSPLITSLRYQNFFLVQLQHDGYAPAKFLLKPSTGHFQLDANLMTSREMQQMERQIDREMLSKIQPYIQSAALLSVAASVMFSRLIDHEIETVWVERGLIRQQASYSKMCAHLATVLIAFPIAIDLHLAESPDKGLYAFNYRDKIHKKRMASVAFNFGINLVGATVLKAAIPDIREREQQEIWRENMSSIHVADMLTVASNIMVVYATAEAVQFLYLNWDVPNVIDYLKFK